MIYLVYNKDKPAIRLLCANEANQIFWERHHYCATPIIVITDGSLNDVISQVSSCP